ncbi:hypothetical protein EI982_14545 [Haloplanus rallus]|uniref:Uncharacterized protein n=1 Tax=Haloplanus rallus TaxID=1816183 RepID=A0A6B9FAW7_9EURY|nr:hypothetical protein [Haloplanus rallus]QGX95917.1 hypothetical protein EI982_14545 [Haloplanus rallus]
MTDVDDDQITACPACDAATIKPRNPGKPSSPPAHTTNWYCESCGAQFDEPVERERYTAGGGRSGLAGKLARADPDDLVTDGGEELVYVAAKPAGGAGILHTEESCPRLGRARKVVEKPRSVYPDDRKICDWCQSGPTQGGGDNSGAWQELAAADPDDLVTDGGEEIVYVRSQATGSGIDVYHTERACNTLQQATQIIERKRRHVPAEATECKHCRGAIGGAENHEPDWEPQRILREAEPGDIVTDGGQAWRPVAGDYVPEREAWLVLYARYAESGWEYAQRVEEPDGTMLRSERGAVAEGEPDLRTDGGCAVADVLAECDARDRVEPLEYVLRGDRDRETLAVEDWLRPVEVTDGAVCLAFDTGQQAIHIGHDGEAFRFTSEFYREGYGGSRPIDDVAEVRALVSRYDPEPVLRESTPFAWGSSRTWDGEDCPHENCDGDLQNQGDANVMCLSCGDVWGHHKNDEEHYLVSKGSNIVARKPRVETDVENGGGERR